MAQESLSLLLTNSRKRSGLTQLQVAERAGTSQAAVARYEKGLCSPSVDTLQRLLKANGFELVLDTKPARKINSRSALAKKIQNKRGEIREILHATGAHNIRIFGSVARGDDKKGSDVDFLVDIKEDPKKTMAAINSASKISRLLGTKVDVTPSHLLKKEVLKSALRDAIPL